MDLLGKKRTGSEGIRTSTGTVRTYDPSCGLGDSISGTGNYGFGSGSSRDLDLYAVGGSDLDSVGKLGLDLNRVANRDDDGNLTVDHKVATIRNEIDMNVDANKVHREDFREEGNVNDRKDDCFDLNLAPCEEILDLNPVIEAGLDLNVNVNEDLNVKDKGVLNVRKVHYFDLNLEYHEDINDVESLGCVYPVSCEVVEKDPPMNSLSNHDDFSSGLGLNSDVLGCAPSANSGAQTMFTASHPVEIELNTTLHNDGGTELGLDTGVASSIHNKRQLKSNTDTVSVSSLRGRRVRKRKPTSDRDTNGVSENILGRSTCRGRKSALFSDVVNDLSSSPTAGEVTGEELSETVGQKGPEVTPKILLPPSSGNLSLGDMPVMDVFFVYSFLRSFSTLLLLSPFGLEDFVSSLKCNTPSLLLDSIHVCLLKTLRKHLESVPDDTSQSASHCFRCYNWDLMDLITWPIFVVKYMQTSNSALKAGFDLCSLKLFENDYYKQSSSVKIEILRCLCDDVIDNDSIKSEVNKSMVTEAGTCIVLGSKFDCSKKRKDMMDIPGSSVTQDNNKETVGCNNDECCLCKLDGNLICCDGCPSAFHSRCVGVIANNLPKGRWYCPECVIVKDQPQVQVGNAMRGADWLGTDAYGRIYFSCCGYLLVQEDCQSAASSKYYSRDDIPAVIKVLKSSGSVFSTITSAVVKHWNFLSGFDGVKIYSGLREGLDLQFSEHSDIHPKVGDVVAEDASLVSATIGGEVLKSVFVKAYAVDHVMNQGDQNLSSESSADASQAVNHVKETTEVNLQCMHSRVTDGLETPRKVSVMSLPSEEKNNDPKKPGRYSSRINAKSVSPINFYVNYYSLAQTAVAISDQLSRKLSKESENALKSWDDILSEQMKAISDKFMELCWPNVLNAQVDAIKESCGWCLPCKVPEVKRKCLISMCSYIPSPGNSSSAAIRIHSEKSRKNRLADVMCHICLIEERLQGLLLGPWLNPQYSKFWRKSFHRATSISSVKIFLLKLESNLHPPTLSADWTKHVDYAVAVGSGVHTFTTSMRGQSRNSLVRKRARCPELEVVTTSDTTSGFGFLWWRGGRLSHRLLNWNVLPRALASKAARQGGCRKIPGILYPDESEFAKRSRFVAWKAGVESSESVEQLALHVREFDANIRWDVIENSIVSLKLEKETSAPVKSFKGVTVHQKCIEGGLVKYLLDFGKRRFIPEVVLRYGSKIEESSCERKKFWLEVSHLPLHLMKDFEQKIRKTNQLNFGKLSENIRVNRCAKRKGFSYLFSKAERSENYQCGHCNKDVHIREAVSCQYCKGFFHKRHVRKSAGSVTAPSTYTCHKCGASSRLLSVASRKIEKPSKDRNAAGGSKVVQGNKRSRKNQTDKMATVAGPVRRSLRNTKSASLKDILRRSEQTNG